MSYPIDMDEVAAKLQEWQEANSRNKNVSPEEQTGEGRCGTPFLQSSYLKPPYRQLDSPHLGNESSQEGRLSSCPNGGYGNVNLGLLTTSNLRDTAERPPAARDLAVDVCEGDENDKPGRHYLRRVDNHVGPLPLMTGDYLTAAESLSRYEEAMLIYYAAVSGQAKRLMDAERKDEADRLMRASLAPNRPQNESGLLEHANRLNNHQVAAILDEQGHGNMAHMATLNPDEGGGTSLSNVATLAPELGATAQQESCLAPGFPRKMHQSDVLQGASERHHPKAPPVLKGTQATGSHPPGSIEQWLEGLPDYARYDEM